MLFGKSPDRMTDEEKRARIASMYERARQSFPGVPEMSAREVMNRRAAGEPVVLVDVRTPEEQAVSKIPGAITAAEFEADPSPHEGAMIVCYCTLGGRSGRYAQSLCARGIDAWNMPGAALSWSLEGGEFVDGEGPTRRLHTHSAKYNFVADGYEAIW